MFELPTFKIFLICSYFLPISTSSFFLLKNDKKLLNQLLSTAQAQIVPNLSKWGCKLQLSKQLS